MLYVEMETILVRTPPKPSGPSGFDAFLRIAERGTPFTALGGRAFITVPAQFSSGHLTLPIRSRAFRQRFFDQCFAECDTIPTTHAFNAILHHLEAQAASDPQHCNVGVPYRVDSRGPFPTPEKILPRPANPEGQFVEITPEGWTVTSREGVPFETSSSTPPPPPPPHPPPPPPHFPPPTPPPPPPAQPPDIRFTPRDPPLHPQPRRPKFPRLAPLPCLAPRRPPHTRPLSHPHPPWSFRLRQIPRRPHPPVYHRSLRRALHPASLLLPRAPHPRPPQLGPRLRPRLHPHPSNRRHPLPPHQRRRRRLPRARPQRTAPAFPQAPHHPHRHRSLDAPSRSRRPRPHRHPPAPHPSHPPPRSRGRQRHPASLPRNPRCPLTCREPCLGC